MEKIVSEKLFFIAIALFFLSGCSQTAGGNVGNLSAYIVPSIETEWIRNGEPIEWREELWYPQDGVDILLDAEVYLIGEYKGVQFFVEKIDVQPYNHLYTKFGHNKFRMFERHVLRDKNKRSF